jgi:formylglycine-generating enzyme required for sulfatase activity
LKREEAERQRLASVAAAAAEAKRRAEVNQSIRRTSPDRLMLALMPGVEMEFVRVPAGEFVMGSDRSKDCLAWDDELPQHRLKLSEYWVGKAPVSVAQFAAYVKATGAKTSASRDVANTATHPVVNVSWDDGIAFCGWASKLGGGEVLLPSEAEWEKAARGTDGRIYPWGNEAPDDTRLNYNQNVKETTPVGRYGAKGQSPFGCDDMAGNLWEWTRSLWGKDAAKPEFGYPYTTCQTEREDPQAGRDVYRVLRGGSFGSYAQGVRCAYRSRSSPSNRYGNYGFRVILRPPSLD